MSRSSNWVNGRKGLCVRVTGPRLGPLRRYLGPWRRSAQDSLRGPLPDCGPAAGGACAPSSPTHRHYTEPAVLGPKSQDLTSKPGRRQKQRYRHATWQARQRALVQGPCPLPRHRRLGGALLLTGVGPFEVVAGRRKAHGGFMPRCACSQSCHETFASRMEFTPRREVAIRSQCPQSNLLEGEPPKGLSKGPKVWAMRGHQPGPGPSSKP